MRTHLELPAVTTTLVLPKPREEFPNRYAFVLVVLALKDEASLCTVLLGEIVGSPWDAELVQQTGDDERFTFRPYLRENVVGELSIAECARGHCWN